MIARAQLLKATTNRAAKITAGESGDTYVGVEYEYVEVGGLSKIKVVKAPAASSKETPKDVYRAGSILQLTWDVDFNFSKRLGFVKYPDFLYASGLLSGPTLLDDSSEGLVATYHVTDDIEKNHLDSAVLRIYVEGE